jgi:hypothetical protein
MAVPYVDLNDMIRNVEYQMSFFPVMSVLSALIEAYRVVNEVAFSGALTMDDRHDILRGFTGCVSALSPDVNCWPIGYDTSICFDSDGVPIP